MKDYIIQNKTAWEYNAYDFWLKQMGTPQNYATRIAADPLKALRRFAACFDRYEGVRIANICGSCGKKAVPLAVLGAEVTVFDISEDNRRYAVELSDAAGVQIDYQVCDVLEIFMTLIPVIIWMLWLRNQIRKCLKLTGRTVLCTKKSKF